MMARFRPGCHIFKRGKMGRKHRYKTYKRAVTVAKKMNTDLPIFSKPVNVYRCRWCRKYHVGHSNID